MADNDIPKDEAPDGDAFVEKVQSTFDAMHEAFQKLEHLGNVADTLCASRREFEEEHKLCGCVSEAFEDLAQMTEVACHILQTYATMIRNAGEKALHHDQELEQAEAVKAQAERIIGGMLNRATKATEPDNTKLN